MTETQMLKYLEKSFDKLEAKLDDFRKEFKEHGEKINGIEIDLATIKGDCYGNGKQGYFKKIDIAIKAINDNTTISLKKLFAMIFGSSISLVTVAGIVLYAFDKI